MFLHFLSGFYRSDFDFFATKHEWVLRDLMMFSSLFLREFDPWDQELSETRQQGGLLFYKFLCPLVRPTGLGLVV